MADLETELKVYLKSKASITALVGIGDAARIYLGFPKQGAALPFIVFDVFGGPSAEHLGGISGMAENRVQIDCYGLTSAAAKAVADVVRYAPLQGHRGAIGALTATGVTSPGGYRHGFDDPSAGANQARFWHSRDYFISYNEPIS